MASGISRLHLAAIVLAACCCIAPPRKAAAAPSQAPGAAAQASGTHFPAPRIEEAVDDTRLITLSGNTHPQARARNDRGRVSADLPLGDLVLVLRRGEKEQAAFDRFVGRLYNPKSPLYHHWLTARQIGDEFGPAQGDIDAINAWLAGHGLAVEEVSPDRMSIRFSGTAAQVESAFHTEIHNLEVNGEKHIANMADPQIPAAVAPVVVGLKALHNFFPRPLHRAGAQVSLHREGGEFQRLGGPATVPTRNADIRAPIGINPEFGTVNGYGSAIEDVTPYDFATIYNVLPLWTAPSPIDGTGQTIAIAGTSNINPADVAAFRSAFGLPVNAPTVVITNSDPGACPTFDPSCSSDLVENTLDVEWSGAVAKGANIVLVTSSAPTASSDSLYLSESYIVQHKTAAIMNVSYGGCELVLGTAGNTQYNNLWETAAGEGIAVFVASGDAGSPACDQGFDQVDGVPYGAQFGLAVNGIGSTPYNTSVGGTDFNWGSTPAPYWNTSNAGTTQASAIGYIPEVPWNESCANPLVLPSLEADAAYLNTPGVVDAESACNFVLYNWQAINTNDSVNLAGLVDTVGGGGGASACTSSGSGDPLTCSGGYAKPAWQAGVPGIPADGHRDIPDVSFFASDGFLGSAYLICVSGSGACTYSSTSEPVAQEVGGTSVASPAMAGIMALINQRSAAAQGSPNAVLYELASKQTWASCSANSVTTKSSCIFNDVVSGSNAMPCQAGTLNCNVANPSDAAGILAGYGAGTGYDQATGLGSLNVAQTVNNWPGVAPLAILSSTGLTFASTPEGYAAATQTVTLKNTGKATLSLSAAGQGISISGTGLNSFSQTNNCGASVAGGNSCVITVTFKPAAVGALSAELKVADNTFGSPQTASLSGAGTALEPAATLSANSLSFSAQWVGVSFSAPAITLSNSGKAALAIRTISITGANAGSFSQTNNCGSSVAVGKSCAITISVKPAIAGKLTAALSVADNAPGSPQSVALSGSGNAVVLSAARLTFPATGIGVAAAKQQITLTDKGTAALSFNKIAISGARAFAQTNTCGSKLAAGASCVVTVSFTPAASGALTATLTIADNAAASPQTVALSGSGTAANFAPASLAFATTPIGVHSAPQTVTLTNKGVAALTVSAVHIAGVDASSFTETNNCGTKVGVGAACTFTVVFTPHSSGSQQGALTVTDSAYASPQSISLSGDGTAVSVSAASLTYASTAVGVVAPAQHVTLTNKGAAAFAIGAIAINGVNAAAFTRTTTCESSLVAGASCIVTVTFKPKAAGAMKAALSIADGAFGSPQSVTLTGTGK